MTAGFAHFDGAHRENFTAALILLCLDADADFRAVFWDLVRGRAGLTGGAVLTKWGREATLDIGMGKKRRSDLWLCFGDGLILVEIKTHNGWKPAGVAQQMRDEQDAKIAGTKVLSAVLLAPSLLIQQLPESDFPKLSWHDFFDGIYGIQQPGHLLKLAVEHWSQNVEREFGISSGTPMLPLDANTAQTGCLVAFLRAAIYRLGGKVPEETVWFSSSDGRPRRHQQWAWMGIAVPGKLPGVGNVYLGIYTFSAAPSGGELGTFFEAYRLGDDDDPIVSIPFNPSDLSPETLNSILENFLAAYVASTAPGEVHCPTEEQAKKLAVMDEEFEFEGNTFVRREGGIRRVFPPYDGRGIGIPRDGE